MPSPLANPAAARMGLPATPADLAADRFAVVLRRLADDLTYGADASRFVGSGVDYAQTRLFQHGDPVKAIDWRVTARTGRLHVKEYEATKRTTFYLLADVSPSMHASSTPLSKRDAATWIASVLGLVALRRRSPAAIIACGSRPPLTVAPAASAASGAPAAPVIPRAIGPAANPARALAPTLSRGRLWGQIEALRLDRAVGPDHLGGPNPTIAAALDRVEGTADATSLVVVISDLHEPGAIAAIRRASQRHDVVTLQLQDPLEAHARHARAGDHRPGLAFIHAREPETGAPMVLRGRRGLLDGGLDPGRELAGTGVRHVVLSTRDQGREVLPALRRLLSERDASRGGGR